MHTTHLFFSILVQTLQKNMINKLNLNIVQIKQLFAIFSLMDCACYLKETILSLQVNDVDPN